MSSLDLVEEAHVGDAGCGQELLVTSHHNPERQTRSVKLDYNIPLVNAFDASYSCLLQKCNG